MYAIEPWTPSTHALWSPRAQLSVHLVVAVAWNTQARRREMALPYELVEIVTKHVTGWFSLSSNGDGISQN